MAAKLLDEFWILVLEVSSLNQPSLTRPATTAEHPVLPRELLVHRFRTERLAHEQPLH